MTKYKNAQWGSSVLLPKGANPEEHSALRFAEVTSYRSLGCRNYPTCVDFACQESWESFVCIYCQWHSGGGRPKEPKHSLGNPKYDRRESLKVLVRSQKGGKE